MVTMKEALAKVDVAQLNDWESERYEEWKDKTWEVSPKQQSVINKMQKLTNGSSNEPPKEDTSFNYGSNIDQDLKNKGSLYDQCHSVLSEYEWFKNASEEARQKYATTLFLSK